MGDDSTGSTKVVDVVPARAEPARAAADLPVLRPLPEVASLPAEPDEEFDRFAGMVRRMLNVPLALVTLVDVTRQVFPGAAGSDGADGADKADEADDADDTSTSLVAPVPSSPMTAFCLMERASR